MDHLPDVIYAGMLTPKEHGAWWEVRNWFNTPKTATTKYLLSTPEREAAPELLGVARDCLGYFKGEWAAVGNHPSARVVHYIKFLETAIALAAPPDSDKE